MRTIAKEFGRSGVTANSIVLGLIDTVPEEFSKGAEKYFTVGRIGTPEDIAAAAVYVVMKAAPQTPDHFETGLAIPFFKNLLIDLEQPLYCRAPLLVQT